MIFLPELLHRYRHQYLRLRTLSGSKRYYIFNIIESHQPIHVGEIVRISNLSQPIVSQVISVLRKSNFVVDRQDNKKVYYSVCQEEINEMLQFCDRLLEIEESKDAILKNNYVKIHQAYHYLKHMLNSGRLVLLEILNRQGGLSVNELVEISGMKQSLVSQNIMVLNDLGCLNTIKEGKQKICTLNSAKIERLKQIL